MMTLSVEPTPVEAMPAHSGRFDAMRNAMVASQLRTNAVNDPRVVEAMGGDPEHDRPLRRHRTRDGEEHPDRFGRFEGAMREVPVQAGFDAQRRDRVHDRERHHVGEPQSVVHGVEDGADRSDRGQADREIGEAAGKNVSLALLRRAGNTFGGRGGSGLDVHAVQSWIAMESE
jgi:hypothetical protein